MKRIYKYIVTGTGVNEFNIPKGAKALSVVMQRGNIVAYMLVDPRNEMEKRKFVLLGTGWDLPDQLMEDLDFVGTVNDEPYIWHLFIHKNRPPMYPHLFDDMTNGWGETEGRFL
jgi:hypothetical protein